MATTAVKSVQKTTPGNVLFHVLNGLVFGVFTLVCIYPFYYLIINSISANDMSANGSIMFYPQGVHLQNYIDILKLRGLPHAALISVGRTVLGSACTVLASVYLGFMFTQSKMWHRKLWYRFLVVTMYFSAGLIPSYINMMNLGLTNTFWIYIIPAIVQPFNIILCKTFLESVPTSLQEAAEIDGAGIVTVFFKVILPVSTPIMATIAIFSAVGQWNSFQDTLIYITDEKYYTLQYVLYTYINQANSLATLIQNSGMMGNDAMADLARQQNPTSIRMTVSVIVVIPILLVYPFFQRFFVKGMMLGAVKG